MSERLERTYILSVNGATHEIEADNFDEACKKAVAEFREIEEAQLDEDPFASVTHHFEVKLKAIQFYLRVC